MTGNRRDDLFEFRPPLTARREAPPSTAPARVAVRLVRATPDMTPRERARHFSTKGTVKRVRPARSAAAGVRRVMVKARVVRMGPAANKALLAHVRYVERDGAGLGGEDGRFFDRSSDAADGRAFAGRCEGDRHHFRVIVNPEDGRELPDLKAYARDFMGRVERDLGTRLDWIGGAHFDTGRPHLHLLIRGKREDGKDLVLSREYVSHGLRGRAQELATEILGPRQERSAGAERDVAADRFTALDRTIVGAAENGRLAASDLPEAEATDLLRRLTHLETRGFVARESATSWRVPGDMRERLQAAGERDARERAAARALGGTEAAGAAARLEAVSLKPGERVVGGLVGYGPIGTAASGPQALVLDLADGRLGHLRVGSLDGILSLDRVPEGAVVEVVAVPTPPRPADRTIAEVAAERGGVYSAAEHRAARRSDREPFIERHVRRLEAMSREGVCEALGDGRFRVPADYEARALAADRARHGAASLNVRVLDVRPLDAQLRADGYTYLDTRLDGTERSVNGARGFGAEVDRALAGRAEHLRGVGLGGGEPFGLRPGDGKRLLMREVQGAIGRLEAGGKPVAIAEEGQAFRGVYTGRVHIGRAAYAVVEGRNAITLAPWRPALDACRGQALAGVLQNGAVDFSFGQQAAATLGLGAGLEL